MVGRWRPPDMFLRPLIVGVVLRPISFLASPPGLDYPDGNQKCRSGSGIERHVSLWAGVIPRFGRLRGEADMYKLSALTYSVANDPDRPVTT